MIPAPIALLIIGAMMFLGINNLATLKTHSLFHLYRQQLALAILEGAVIAGGLIAMFIWPELLVFWRR